MRHGLRLSTVVVAVAATALTTTAARAANAAPSAPSAPSVSSASSAPTVTAPTVSSAPRLVRLITGDAVTVHTVAGRTSATAAIPGATSMQVGAGYYVLPPAARYYGAVLDPALFDVATAGASTPVTVSFTGARPSIPGLTVTSSTSSSLQGYVSAAGSRAFGAALLAQWHRDLAAGTTAPATLFGATRIAKSAATTVHPDFPQVTLVIHGIGTDGAPLRFAFIALINTDDARRYNAPVFLYRGEARVSVPLGNYSMIGEQDTFGGDEDDPSFDTAIKTIPDFAVTSNRQVVTLDFRDATVRPSVSLSASAALQEINFEWVRTVPHGGASIGYIADQYSTVEIAPAPAPVHGTVDWVATATFLGKPAKSALVRYDATYDDHGAISADQSHTVDLSQAGRVDANFYSTSRSKTAFYGRSALYPFDFGAFTELLPQPTPLAQTQYVVGPPEVNWVDAYDGGGDDENSFQIVLDEPRSYAAKSQQRIDWLRGPIAAGAAEPTDDSEFFFCPGCRTDDRLGVFLAPIIDSQPGHNGYVFVFDPDTVVATFTLYRDGKQILSLPNFYGASAKVPADAAAYRAVVETDLGAVGFRRSTHAVTELGFPSAAGQGGALPDGWFCSVRGDNCRVLPLLTAAVPLPTDLTGALPLGRSTFVFTVDGVRGGPAVTVPSATMSISVDGGPDRTVPVTALGGGRFQATVTHAAADAGKPVSLKVAGADTQGDSITETVTDAYTVASS